jgi:hypothetical protein
MGEEDNARSQVTPTTQPQSRPLPNGYQQGLITAITVPLGFSLAFLRFWGFERPGSGLLGRSFPVARRS